MSFVREKLQSHMFDTGDVYVSVVWNADEQRGEGFLPEISEGQMLRAVIFDMCGVLVSRPSDYWDVLETELRLEPGSIKRTLRSNKEIKRCFAEAQIGRMSMEEFEPIFARALAQELNLQTVIPVPLFSGYANFMTERVEVTDAVRFVQSFGLTTCLLTNNLWLDKAKSQTLIWPPALGLFDIVLESARIGLRKPMLEIFRYTLAELGLAAEEVVFLDDVSANVKAAASIGLHAIKVDEDYLPALDKLKQLLERSSKSIG